ncbi:MAG: hypothetical protein PHW41_04710 [Eubacteriales bacterium]|nr:hypothetical protein [Eubacteriales bacterium]
MKEFLNIEEEVIYNKLVPGKHQQGDASCELLSAADLNGCSGVIDAEKVIKNISDLGELIITLKETSENYAFRPLFSDSKVLGKVILFAKKAIRKLLKWYIEPICFQQTTFNLAVTQSIEQLAKIQADLIVSVAELTRQQKRNEAEETKQDTVLQATSSNDKP